MEGVIGGMTLDAAVAAVQARKSAENWDFIESLPKVDADAKTRYKKLLLAPDLEAACVDAAQVAAAPSAASPKRKSGGSPGRKRARR